MVKTLGLHGCLGGALIPAFWLLCAGHPTPHLGRPIGLKSPGDLRSAVAARSGDLRRARVTRNASEWGPLSPRLRFGLRSPDDRLAPQLTSVAPARGGFLLQAQQPLLKRLPPKDRARVLAALAGLIILGFALVLLAWWGARFTRRYLRRPWPGSKRSDAGRVSEFDWASKPMYPKQDSDEQAEGDPRE